MLTIGHLLEALSPYRAAGDEPEVRSVGIDSREMEPGDVFVAFRGERRDGHDYASEAFARGAIAALVEHPVLADATTIDFRSDEGSRPPLLSFDRPLQVVVDDTMSALQQWAAAWRSRFELPVTGITGSVGKTTTKELTYAVLSRRFETLKSEGNFNNEIGLPLTVLQLRPHHRQAVLEMGMYALGEISLLCDIARPSIGVVTIVGPVHMSRLGSLEAIVDAKRELVESLPESGAAILNYDEPLVKGMASHTRARVFYYGLDPSADLWADEIESRGLSGVSFTLHYEGETIRIQVPLLGRHSVHTALRATAVGLTVGMRWDEIVDGLQDERAQLRLVTTSGLHGSLILDDTYNASPESVIAALNLLEDLPGRRIAVLGDMLELGPAEERSHRLVGRRVKGVAHILVTVGARGKLIAEEALLDGMPASRVFSVGRAVEAIEVLEGLIDAGDVILVKGSRAVELDQVVAALSRREMIGEGEV